MRIRSHSIVVIVVPIALLIAGMTQVSTAAGVTSPPVATVEAEQMTIPVGASIVNDTTASGGKAVGMARSSTSLTGQVSLPASASSVSLIAKGTKNRAGWPWMTMKIDGNTAVPLQAVSSSTWHTYTVSISLAPGIHTLTYTDASTRGAVLYADAISFSPTPPASSTAIPASYFGAHIMGPMETDLGGSGVATTWPSWSPTTVRLWNTWGYNPNKGIYENLFWKDINTANGVYNWGLFDAILAKHKAEGVTDLLYTFGYTPKWAGGGASFDQAPSNNQYLANFATAVAQRAIADGLPIKSWEIWNEPNNGVGTWTGTNAQMVSMAQTIYGAVKAVDPSNKVLTPSPEGNATAWTNGYLAAGGGAYADIMAFHGYTGGVPEAIMPLIDNYKKVFATYGQSGKPIWDTEAMDITTSDPTMQARFLAVYYLVHQAKGVSRFYWYAWDGDQGTEWFYTSGLGAPGAADVQVHNWMLGASPGSLGQNGTIYSLPLTKGSPTLAVWNSAGSSAYATGTYTHYTDLAGVVHAISGGTVTIGKAPILLS